MGSEMCIRDRSSTARDTFREGSIARAAVGGLRQVAQSRRFWGYTLISAFSMAIFFAFVAGAPYLMNGPLGRPPSEYGLWFLGVPGLFAVGSFAATRLLNTLGLDRSVMLGAGMGSQSSSGQRVLRVRPRYGFGQVTKQKRLDASQRVPSGPTFNAVSDFRLTSTPPPPPPSYCTRLSHRQVRCRAVPLIRRLCRIKNSPPPCVPNHPMPPALTWRDL